MARLSRATPQVVVVDIREDSDVDDTSYNYNKNNNNSPTKTAALGARRGGNTVAMKAATTATSATATARGKQKPLTVARSPTKAKSGTDSNTKSIAATDDDDNDTHLRAPTQTARGTSQQQRQRRQLGYRHINSLLMPFPAAIERYGGLTAGRGLGDVENAPLPEQLEEYKYGAGREGGGRNKEKGKENEKEKEKEKEGEEKREEEVEGKHEWRDNGRVESESEEEDEDENENEETDEFDSLDDFIVGDDEDISYFDHSSLVGSDEDGEDEQELFTKPRSSPRKLFKGLRTTTPKAPLRDKGAGGNNTNTSPGGGGGGGGGGGRGAVNSNLNVNVKAGSNMPTPPSLFEDSSDDDDDDDEKEVIPSLPKKFDLKPPSSFTASKARSPKKGRGLDRKAPSDNMEEPEKTDRAVSIVTPPSSPSKPRLYSPSKSKSRIPPTPHRPSIDAFWSQDIINEWNDQYSPRKMNTPGKGLERFHIYSDNEGDNDHGTSGEARSSISPPSSPSRSPIKGSPTKKASAAAAAATKKALAAKKKEFDEKKVGMAEDFFKTLDDTVTGGEIQRLAAAAGGVKIIWSKTLNTTAGRANWKRETIRQKPSSLPVQSQSQSKQQASSSLLFSPSGYEDNKTLTSSKPTPNAPSTNTSNNNNNTIPLTPSLLAPVRHHASIELASKVIDSEDRLLNTLAHEYCHLANFMISNVRNNPHGTSFKQWAAKCEKALAAHPVYGSGSGGKAKVHITTKHSYVIHYKYLWCCVECGHEYGRHSRSIDVKKSRCGRCKVGGLVQVRPKPRGGSAKKGVVGANGGVKGMGMGIGIGGVAVAGVTKSMGGVHLDMW
ncbi:hypothetical protein GX50_08866 [[Emmonsia] crescens]|uniref:SprT-like domain-containing protein n=1 Tax=[Emmonsia] crescens TaxID=73230 RepID=A0A2B7Z3C3_9EURO|nr:hypothetical protein GX50_08866 [Emmonsia crescens]